MAQIPANDIEISPTASLTSLETVVERLDGARLGLFHVRLLLVCGVCWLFVAQGMSIVGFILPALGQAWGLTSIQKGVIASFGVLGMVAGAVLAGSLADRIGRRSTLALVITWVGVFSLLSSLAGSYLMLLCLRTLTGIGLGAALPVASTLVSEYSPARYRGRLLVLLDGFSGLGIALSALIGYSLAESSGWRLALLGTGLAVVCAPLVLFLLPESPRFQMGKGRLVEAQQTARRIRVRPDERVVPQPENPAAPMGPAPQVTPSRPASAGLWSPPYLRLTASLWLLWFSLNFTFQGVFVWLPSMLRAGGNTPAQSDLMSLIISLGQVPGTLVAVFLADRINRRLTLILAMIFWGVAVYLFGLSVAPAGVLVWGVLLAIGNAVAYGLAYPFTTELYPTRMRGSATGWASGFGRIGGILAPWVVGWLIQSGVRNSIIFALLAAAPILTALALGGLRRETTGRTLEESSR